MPDEPQSRERSRRPGRGEPREIVELRQLKVDHPELSGAADLHIALLELQRRVQARIPLPWIEISADYLARRQAQGHPLLRFEDIPLDWTDLRLMFRQTADILRRHDALEPDDHRSILALARTGNTLEPVVVHWFNERAAPELVADKPDPTAATGLAPEALDPVLVYAMRPFLARCAEVVGQRIDLSGWRHPHCPLCGAEPEFAVITQAADRVLICGRCTGVWRYLPLTCPFCQNDDRTLITSFTSRDGRYRIYACDVCRRYLKAFDGRHSPRPVMLAVDSVATLPLDAAAMQKGYRG